MPKINFSLKIISFFLVLMIFSVQQNFLNLIFAESNYNNDISVVDKNPLSTIAIDSAGSYETYLGLYKDAIMPQKQYEIQANSYSNCSYKPEFKENFEEMNGLSVLTNEDGFIEWPVNIEQSGFYNMEVVYYPISGKSSEIVRNILIDGKLPYKEARNVSFYRVWECVRGKDMKIIQRDKKDNDILPNKIEKPEWVSLDVKDSVGYIREPLKFYFSSGSHTIRFDSVKEPLLISKIILHKSPVPPNYEQVKAEYEKKGYKKANATPIKIQAEELELQSNPIIQAVFDRSSPATEPNSPSKLRLNALGAHTWAQNGQWVSWEFDVKESGLYVIGIKAIQNITNGSFSSRRIYIDGEVPFNELNDISYNYSNKWDIDVLGENKNPYEFYFEKGKHQIKIEVSLGSIAPILNEISDISSKLNSIYRKILVVTGSVPDVSRDYQFEIILKDVIEDLKLQSERLKQQYDLIVNKTGMNGENVQILKKIYMQASEMAKRPNTIANRFSAFQINISSLGTWISATKNQPLTIDYFIIAPIDYRMPKVDATFFENIDFFVNSFISSFFQDYDLISDTKNNKSVKVWVGNGVNGGRDQAQLIKTLSDNTFSKENDIQVDLQLVTMGTLLPSTLAGNGPDVALTLGMGDPVNYACRHAVVDLKTFPDFDEISKRFHKSSIDPFEFENGVYALPETSTYPMLFYRKDILQDLKLSIPQTWDDVITMLPVLQKVQMNFGLPPAAGTTGVSFTTFATLLYQNGGQLYKNDHKKTDIDSKSSIDSFSFLTSLYSDYNIPVVVDFANRFRTGDTPIGIADFSFYNQLSVFAPELDGMWSIAEVPGVKKDDGTINRSTPNNVNACIILEKSKHKSESWKFIKWWTSNKTQVAFGREIESILGIAARYPTANIEAMYQIPWKKSDFDSLMRQNLSVVGVEQVPGGYYTARYLDFAFRNVINNQADPSESLTKAAKNINSEIRTKRREFGLAN